ncbi:radical SAM protein [Pseudomonas sp. RC10]|uniref:coproporphyrinogen-III oxidase family protein n=1 Tax=Pseudomonas bambusae TaxID=3139142 RepID=UPI003139D4E4
MKILNNGLVKFDYQFPLYNFFFPSQSHEVFRPNRTQLSQVFETANNSATSRALYFHIPFCEAICSFCPFTRGFYKNSEEIDRYTQALIKEIEYKSRVMDLKKVPVRAIFFGGGTPSLLSPRNINDIGEALHRYFDMSNVEEFSFEFHITSVSEERTRALADIGVTHARFGLQTIDPTWRKLFNLSQDITQIERAAETLVSSFQHVLCDILYGMNGSNESQTLTDIDKAVDLGVTNIDIYPINNVVTSLKLHRQIKQHTSEIFPAMRKLNMRLMIDEHMRQKGYLPYNGHGYIRQRLSREKLFASNYSFIYHEHVYGYADHDVLGFGVGGISSLAENVITNTSLREQYTIKMTSGIYECNVSQHASVLDLVKPIVLRLPYHGEIEKDKIAFSDIPSGLFTKLEEMIRAGLICETEKTYELTKLGWLWYSNIMFYLCPQSEQNILKKLVFEKLSAKGRDITKDEIIYSTV